ncbi:hypothetical protein [Streptomyces cucumeris]|uniref:hypothetical protein n=1 Tax=Streptomyces cucumeris TaxID=2962890 RepID=UPI0020C8386E|nr:hypothetical protein [Streptomyces sp. NEAU-Y11]MCP9206761.1 hypothetical protein [Streptomyces sp. NEAU-Y11]MCP9211703.1 hypothetical protein [Streptomyces sp. NEAU-Y11]
MNAHRETGHPRDTAAPGARRLRVRYAGIGIFMAFTWVGEGNAPAWEHALRTLAILLILPPVFLRADRHLTHKLYEATRPAPVIAQLITARVVIITAAFGASNLLGHLLDPDTSRSPVMPAAGLLLLLLSIPAQIRRAHRTRARAVHPSARPALSAPRLMLAKLTLVIGALLVQLLLGASMDNATYVAAAAIAVTTALLGPVVHRRLMVARTTGAVREPVRGAA